MVNAVSRYPPLTCIKPAFNITIVNTNIGKTLAPECEVGEKNLQKTPKIIQTMNLQYVELTSNIFFVI